MNSLQILDTKYAQTLKGSFAYLFVSRKHDQILHFDSFRILPSEQTGDVFESKVTF